MYFGLSEDQSFFQDNVLKFLDDNAGLDIVKSITSKADKNLQQEIHSGLTNLGYTNMLIPEEYGGLGLDLLFATAVSQSLGAGIAPVPFAGSYVMAPIAITNGGNKDQKKKYLEKMSSGEIKLATGFSEYIATRDKGGFIFEGNKVNGTSLFVMDCEFATHILLADEKGQLGIVDLNADGIENLNLTTIDKTRNLKEIVFKDAQIEILSATISDSSIADHVIDAGRIIIAADSIGASQIMIDKAVAYSKERKQFNRVIGSFQAVKHMCAEMTADLEPCYSLVWHAAHLFEEKTKESRLMACHAKSHVSEISQMVAKKATEVHGGMGFTDLLGLHFWFKRIGLNRQILGAPEIVREEAGKIQGF